MKPILAAPSFLWNEASILWLRAELAHACNPAAPHSGARILKLMDAMQAARKKRPAWFDGRSKERTD